MTFLLLLASLLFGLPEPSRGRPQAPDGPAADSVATSPRIPPTRPFSFQGGAAEEIGSPVPPVCPAGAPLGSETPPEAVQQRRSQFAELVKLGVLERFDDSRQQAIFKRNVPVRSAHETDPLEDEAIASGARDALSASYAKLKLRLHLSCKSGRLSIGSLPDDPVLAASVIDTLLALDGVQAVAAALPPSLRMPP